MEMINKSTISNQVLEYFRDKIMNHELRPNERIIETRVAKELGVSQGSVREAIQKLDAMGLVKVKPYSGTFVRPFDEKRLKDAYELRNLLEGFAASYACEKISDQTIERMKQLRSEMDIYAAGNDKRSLIKCDVEFHREIILAADNSILEKMWDIACVPQWTGYTIMKHDDVHYFPKSHDGILRYIVQRDTHNLISELEKHFDNAKTIAVKNWIKHEKTNDK
jgi:DNA-binding GntR family transcriptional regulator